MSPLGTFSARGAPWTSRRSSCSQARWNGLKTEYGLDVAHVGHEQARGAVHLELRERVLDPAVAGGGERRHVGGEVERGGADFTGKLGELLLGPALADDELAAALAQRLAQLGEAAVEEPRAVGGREAPFEQARVEHEDGHHAIALAVGGGQGRVVVHAEVAPEPDEGGAHPWGTGERRT